MSFLAPLFLLGGAAILGPILFHLIRRTTREVTPFSSLMFLLPTPPRVTKRSRLENLWLLLLRCLALLLLALAFARPFFVQPASSQPPTEGVGKRTVVLLDTSASMRREKLWPDAVAKAEAILRAAAPADEVAVVTFDRVPRQVVSFEDWRQMKVDERSAASRERLKTLAPTWAGTQLDAALIFAADLLDQAAKDGPHPREIILISDLQEGARIDALQGHEWPQGLVVDLQPVRATKLANAGVQWLTENAEGAAPAQDTLPRLLLTNSAESQREQFQLRWGAGSLDVYAPPGRTRIVRPPAAPPQPGEPIVLTGDDVDFDNRLFFAPPQPVVLPVLFVGADGDDDPRGSLFYLRQAFPRTRGQRVEITAHRTADAVPAFQLQQAQLLVLSDTAADAAVDTARRFAEGGRTVVLPLTSASGGAVLGRLLGGAAPTVTEAPVKEDALLARIDFQHPIFTAFADPRFSDFTKIHFWKHRRLDPAAIPGARVLASFDDGDPALLEVPLGAGRVHLLTTSWRPLDSQLALSSKFVPILHAMLEQSSNVPPQKAQYFVGEEIALPPREGGFTMRAPDGRETAVQERFTATDQPGLYLAAQTGTRYVVNLAPDERRLTPLAPERFTALGVPLRQAAAKTVEKRDPQREAQAQAAEVEARQKLWRWLLAGALLVLLLETLIAGKLSRARAVPTEATP